MTCDPRSGSCRLAVLAMATLTAGLGVATTAAAQRLTDLQTPDSPLVLKSQGSFFVWGEKADQTAVELGSFGPAGHVSVNQMYVRFMFPQAAKATSRW